MDNKTATHIFPQGAEFTLSSMNSLGWNNDIPNYAFLKWTTNPDGTGDAYYDKQAVSFLSDEVDLYAQWMRIYYLITVNAGENGKIKIDDGDATNEDSKLLDPGQTCYIYAIPDTGYDFVQWNDGNKEETRKLLVNSSKQYSAEFKIHEYNITYQLNGGTNPSSNPTKYFISSETIEFANPYKKGYLGTFEPSIIEHGSFGDREITANFSLESYPISYVLNGGTHYGNPYAYTIEDEIVFNKPQMFGHAGEFNPPKIDKGTTGIFKTDASYSLVSYKITYQLNGGTHSGNPSTYTVEDEIVFNKPTKNGYVGSFNPPAIFPGTIEGNLTVIAEYSPLVFQITYQLNGGAHSGNPETYTAEDEIVFNSPTKPGYSGSFSPSKINKGTTGNLTVVASYSPISYNITYQLNGGTHSGNPSTYTMNDAITFKSPVKTGYTGSFSPSGISKGTTGNLTVVANYSIIYYTITYNLNGGTNPSSNPTAYTVNDSITFSKPTKSGYTNGRFSPAYINKGTTGNQTVTASYDPMTYSITYELNGHGTRPNKSSYQTGESYTPPALTESGYVFNGWSPTSIVAGTYGNVKFTASWTKQELKWTSGQRISWDDDWNWVIWNAQQQSGYTYLGTFHNQGAIGIQYPPNKPSKPGKYSWVILNYYWGDDGAAGFRGELAYS